MFLDDNYDITTNKKHTICITFERIHNNNQQVNDILSLPCCHQDMYQIIYDTISKYNPTNLNQYIINYNDFLKIIEALKEKYIAETFVSLLEDYLYWWYGENHYDYTVWFYASL